MRSKQKGSYGVGVAIAYFTSVGCIVSLPINDSQDYDIVIDDGTLKKVQVKYTSCKNEVGNYTVSLRSISGTSRKAYAKFSDSSAELLFVLDGDGRMLKFSKDEIKVTSCITLTEEVVNKHQVRLGQ